MNMMMQMQANGMMPMNNPANMSSQMPMAPQQQQQSQFTEGYMDQEMKDHPPGGQR